MKEWIGAYQGEQSGVQINYQATGSGQGIKDFIAQNVDFAATDAFMKDQDIASAKAARSGADVVHIPMVHGAVVLAYKLEGVDKLILDGPTTAKIFLGKIKKWDDAAIKALNPGVKLPSDAIIVVHRADDSGTSSIFTNWLASTSDEWKRGPGAGKEASRFPTGISGPQNAGVANAVAQNDGAIGYLELAYAEQTDTPYALVKNDAGDAVKATTESTAKAAASASVPDDLRFDITGVKDGYPIVGTTWVVAYTKGYGAKAAAIKGFLTWALQHGDEVATKLDYAPIPDTLQTKALAMVDKIGA
jgi:phosphate transport system substrate-binding protein